MTVYGQPQPQPQPRPAAPVVRRKRRVWLVLVVILAILLVLLAVADRAGSAVAESQLRDRVAVDLANRDIEYATLDVSVGGVPFLTQVAQGRYESITIDLTEAKVDAGTRRVTLPTMSMVATNVRADTSALMQGDPTATADEVTGTGLVTYETLSSLLNVSTYHLEPISFELRDGAVRATTQVTVLDLQLPVEAIADLTVNEGRLEVRLRDATIVAAGVPDGGLAVLDVFANAVLVAAMPSFPFGLTLDRVATDPQGVVLTATGQDVSLVR